MLCVPAIYHSTPHYTFKCVTIEFWKRIKFWNVLDKKKTKPKTKPTKHKTKTPAYLLTRSIEFCSILISTVVIRFGK